jgi:flagellar basal body-associated protein FliL
MLATVAIGAGLALNWSWLVAAGITPILLGVLPCLAMCALGLCMHRAGGKSCAASAESAPAEPTAVTPEVPPLPRLAGNGGAEERPQDKASDHG